MEKDLKLRHALEDSPIIAAVKNDDGLHRAIESDCAIIFLLYGSICSTAGLVQQAKEAGKLVFVHIDLIEGLSSKDVAAVDYIHTATATDGIISTRPALLRRGRELGLLTIQRFFLLDSIAFDNVLRQASNADAIDILPGTMPKTIARLCQKLHQPLIASGLLADKEDVMAALGAGAVAVSSTSPDVWFL